MVPLIEPGTMPIVFETFATSGGKPRKRRTGKVTSDPEPTIVLMVPAAIPAMTMRIAPSGSIKRDSRGDAA
jgi:hypothetical protein